MCQATIPLRVRYRLPFSRRPRRHHEGADGAGPAGGEQQEGAAAAAEGIPGLAALVAQLQVRVDGHVGLLYRDFSLR